MEKTNKGILLVISGPAGSGKGTVVKYILDSRKDFSYSVSATTRSPRVGEQNGVHYYFIDRPAFEKRISENQMLEYTEYCGNLYGTPREEVEGYLDKGINVILEIEVTGALNIKKLMPEAVLVLILPPTYKILEDRLRGRGTNTEEDIKNRLATAKEELGHFSEYDYFVKNEDGRSDDAAEVILNIVDIEKHRTSRCIDELEKFYNV